MKQCSLKQIDRQVMIDRETEIKRDRVVPREIDRIFFIFTMLFTVVSRNSIFHQQNHYRAIYYNKAEIINLITASFTAVFIRYKVTASLSIVNYCKISLPVYLNFHHHLRRCCDSVSVSVYRLRFPTDSSRFRCRSSTTLPPLTIRNLLTYDDSCWSLALGPV